MYQFTFTQVDPRQVVLVRQCGSKDGSVAATLGVGWGSQNSRSFNRCSSTRRVAFDGSSSLSISGKSDENVSVFAGSSLQPVRSQKNPTRSCQHLASSAARARQTLPR